MNKDKYLRLLLLLLFTIGAPVLAMEQGLPLRFVGGLERASPERVRKVKTARVILCDYELVKKDFPALRHSSMDEIDRWIVDNVGYISTPQSSSNEVNDTIEIIEGHDRVVYRPEGYGRALVFPTMDGLLDVKGVGVAPGHVPKNVSHRNGLMTLGEAIREYAMQKLVEHIFVHYKSAGNTSRLPLSTVQSYAVIDLGFDIFDNHSDFKIFNKNRARAGAIVRQGHGREILAGADNHFLYVEEAREVELILREYGITSSGNIYKYIDIPDIQGTKEKYIVDFGTYVCMEKFEKQLTRPLGVRKIGKTAKTPCKNVCIINHSCPHITWDNNIFADDKSARSQDIILRSTFLPFGLGPKKSRKTIRQPNSKIAVPFLLWGHNKNVNPEGKCNMDLMRCHGECFSIQLQRLDSQIFEHAPTPKLKRLIAREEQLALVNYCDCQELALLNTYSDESSYQKELDSLKMNLSNTINYCLNSVNFKWNSKEYGKIVPFCPSYAPTCAKFIDSSNYGYELSDDDVQIKPPSQNKYLVEVLDLN